jgi:hypothetical protein
VLVIGFVLVTFLAIEGARLGASLWISHWADADHSAGNHPNHTNHTNMSYGVSGDVIGATVLGDHAKSKYYFIGIYGAISGSQAALTLINRLIVVGAARNCDCDCGYF